MIQFSGFVHREELPEIYAFADALIFPTHSDPWGLVVNEAMACNVPVILTSVAGCASDLVQDGENGFVIPPRDVAQLARAMARVAEDSAIRVGNGAQERRTHRGQFAGRMGEWNVRGGEVGGAGILSSELELVIYWLRQISEHLTCLGVPRHWDGGSGVACHRVK